VNISHSIFRGGNVVQVDPSPSHENRFVIPTTSGWDFLTPTSDITKTIPVFITKYNKQTFAVISGEVPLPMSLQTTEVGTLLYLGTEGQISTTSSDIIVGFVHREGFFCISLKNIKPVQWEDIENKPFETVESSFNIVDSELKVPVHSWEDIENKPFDTIESSFNIVENELQVPINSWEDIENKPFETVESSFGIVENELQVPTYSWEDIENKPFDTVGSNLTIVDNTLQADSQLPLETDGKIRGVKDGLWEPIVETVQTVGDGLELSVSGELSVKADPTPVEDIYVQVTSEGVGLTK